MARSSSTRRRTLATSCAVHALHDGLTDALYVLLPVWSQAYGLTLTQAGVLKTAYSAALAGGQLPAARLAERLGAPAVLALGTAAGGAAYLAFGLAGGFAALLALALAAGLGSSVQHPIASAMVADAFREGRRRAALGTYNFAGDLGKVLVPAALALAIAGPGVGAGTAAIGLLALAAAGAVLAFLGSGRREAEQARQAARGGFGITNRRGFTLLCAVTMIDFATRAGFLTLLPFVLIEHGLATGRAGFALALVFAGGAAGKFLCGFLTERFGLVATVVATETLTAAGIVAAVALPIEAALLVLPLAGLGLNGTSSALYGTVPEVADPDRLARAHGLFYTIVVGAYSLAPIVAGALGDAFGVSVAMLALATGVLATIPLAIPLSAAVDGQRPVTG